MGEHGKNPGAISPGGGSPDCEAIHSEDHGRDRRESGTEDEGYVKEGGSCAALVKWIEANFDCRNGHYGSHADGPNLDPETSTIEEARKHAEAREAYRYITLAYITQVLKSKNPEIQRISDSNALEICRNGLLNDFIAIRDQFPVMPKPTLYWRFHESGRFGEEINASHKRLAQVRTRVAIPGAIFEKIPSVTPEGAPTRML